LEEIAMTDKQLSENKQTPYGFWIIIAGFVVVSLAFVLSVYKWSDSKDVTAAVGTVAGTVGTLAGAYFGVHAGAAGKEKAEQERDDAQQKVERLAALMEPGTAARALNIT
jgi:hypothetical protein